MSLLEADRHRCHRGRGHTRIEQPTTGNNGPPTTDPSHDCHPGRRHPHRATGNAPHCDVCARSRRARRLPVQRRLGLSPVCRGKKYQQVISRRPFRRVLAPTFDALRRRGGRVKNEMRRDRRYQRPQGWRSPSPASGGTRLEQSALISIAIVYTARGAIVSSAVEIFASEIPITPNLTGDRFRPQLRAHSDQTPGPRSWPLTQPPDGLRSPDFRNTP